MIEPFDAIKESMVQEAVLHIPDPSKPDEMKTDASDYAVGAVLYQRDGHGDLRPVAFFSGKPWSEWDERVRLQRWKVRVISA